MFILKPTSGVPIYKQLSDQIRRLVASGQLGPGDPLPSIRDLALEHTINPMTVSKVYSLLEAEGLLERHRGKPMTVAPQKVSKTRHSERLRQILPQLEAVVLAAHQLELDREDLVGALRQQWEKGYD